MLWSSLMCCLKLRPICSKSSRSMSQMKHVFASVGHGNRSVRGVPEERPRGARTAASLLVPRFKRGDTVTLVHDDVILGAQLGEGVDDDTAHDGGEDENHEEVVQEVEEEAEHDRAVVGLGARLDERYVGGVLEGDGQGGAGSASTESGGVHAATPSAHTAHPPPSAPLRGARCHPLPLTCRKVFAKAGASRKP